MAIGTFHNFCTALFTAPQYNAAWNWSKMSCHFFTMHFVCNILIFVLYSTAFEHRKLDFVWSTMLSHSQQFVFQGELYQANYSAASKVKAIWISFHWQACVEGGGNSTLSTWGEVLCASQRQKIWQFMVYCNQVDLYLDQAECCLLFYRTWSLQRNQEPKWYIFVFCLPTGWRSLSLSGIRMNHLLQRVFFPGKHMSEHLFLRLLLLLWRRAFKSSIICTQQNSTTLTFHSKLHRQPCQQSSRTNAPSKNVFITANSSADMKKKTKNEKGTLPCCLPYSPIWKTVLLRDRNKKQTMALTLSRCLHGDKASL